MKTSLTPSLLPVLLAVCLAAPAVAADHTEPLAADRAMLRSAGLSDASPDLLAFLRLRSKESVERGDIAALVERLASAKRVEATRAAAELIGIGYAAVPALRALARNVDAPGATAASRCLRAVEKDSGALTGAVLRLVAASRPDGAAAVLLAFLPHAEDENVVAETVTAVAAVATRHGKPDPALLQALQDPVALRRATAVDVLCEVAADELPAVRKLLLDPVPAVRLRAALALACAGEPEGVSTVIALLADLPMPLALQAEEYLIALAGEQAPKVELASADTSLPRMPPARDGKDAKGPDPADEATLRVRCRNAWAAWWRGTENSAPACEELRKRIRAEVDRDKVEALIRGLGDDSFEVRQKSTDGLKALGTAVAPLLRQASNHPDLEVRQRTQALLQEIQRRADAPLSLAVPRILALRKPAGAAELLLAYLPFADDDKILAEARQALDAVAYRDGKPDPAVVQALRDKSTARRAAAAEALSGGPTDRDRGAVRQLLNDPEPVVRLGAALGLARSGDRSAVSVLIALTAEPADGVRSAAEEYLTRLARDRLPPAVIASLGTDAAARARRRDAWADWWQTRGEDVEMLGRSIAALPPTRYLGYTLLVQTQGNRVCELDAAGKARWEITGLNGPQDARVLPGDRVLITESAIRRITERDLKGNILWQKDVNTHPISARRLANGHTFIVSQNGLSEVDRTGREVLSISLPGNDVMTAEKLRDGKIVVVSSQSRLLLLDPTGKELKSVHLVAVSNFGNDILPGGGVLVPLAWQNKVMEYDADGKVVWEADAVQPMSAFRLPNGHTLVGTQQWPAKVIELDRDGKQVAETPVSTFVQRATRR